MLVELARIFGDNAVFFLQMGWRGVHLDSRKPQSVKAMCQQMHYLSEVKL